MYVFFMCNRMIVFSLKTLTVSMIEIILTTNDIRLEEESKNEMTLAKASV